MPRYPQASIITRRTLANVSARLSACLMLARGRGDNHITLSNGNARRIVQALNAAIVRETPTAPRLPERAFD